MGKLGGGSNGGGAGGGGRKGGQARFAAFCRASLLSLAALRGGIAGGERPRANKGGAQAINIALC